jgi:hypothetical protein
MVRISYDEENTKEVKLIEDYFFYKYYVETVKSDWSYFIKEALKLPFLEQKAKFDIVINHLNKYELERAVIVHENTYCYDMKKHINEYYFLSDITAFNPVKIIKNNLIRTLKKMQ